VATSLSGNHLVKQATIAKHQRNFDPHAFLSTIGKGREMLSFENKKTIFAQGDPSDGLFLFRQERYGSVSYLKPEKKQLSPF
jgi:hypothetical protein